jgi:hypothetical protein
MPNKRYVKVFSMLLFHRVATIQLLTVIPGFYPFPANTKWPQGHASSFSEDLRFTFNDTHYDFDGSLRLYKTFNASLSRAFAPFKHGFTNTLGIPNSNGDRGASRNMQSVTCTSQTPLLLSSKRLTENERLSSFERAVTSLTMRLCPNKQCGIVTFQKSG